MNPDGAGEKFSAEIQRKLEHAHEFELSYRAHRSVSDDPFYIVPPDTGNAAAGSLLKLEEQTDTSLYTLAPNLSLSRFIYQSTTSKGALVPVSGYVLWPYVARPHSSGYPVIAWAHGTSGVSDECAPSNMKTLWHHFQAPYQFALNGYVVVATDYAGLGVGTDARGKFITHEYLTALAQANDVINSILAARKAIPEISNDFVVVGSSQGGAAAWKVAEIFVDHPLNGYRGTVALSPAVRLLEPSSAGRIESLLLIMLMPSLQAKYNIDPSEVLSPLGLKVLDAYIEMKGCTTVLANLPIGPDLLIEGWQNNSAIQTYQQVAEVGRKAFAGPMFVATGKDDTIVSNSTVSDAVSDIARTYPEAKLDYYMLSDVSHTPVMFPAWQMYSAWISDRFAGSHRDPGLQNHTIQPTRPLAAQQIEANWYIQRITAPWQQA